MGITRFISTLKKHSVMASKPLDITPNTTHLFLDYNANIHYILQQVINNLNEVLIYLFTIERETDVNIMATLTDDQVEDLHDYYDSSYQIGKTYEEVQKKLSDKFFILNIIFTETIKYTRQLISSVNTSTIRYIYIALDGVPSNAKVKEQKNRRYISALVEKTKADILTKFTNDGDKVYQLNLFEYRINICPGSELMEKLEQAMYNLGFDGITLEVSGSHIRGEGEKKIIHKILELSPSTNLSDSIITIMSPDSDMFVLLSLLKKCPCSKLYNFRIDYFNNNAYEFFEINDIVNSFREYFSTKNLYEYSFDDMVTGFFMFYVFGNDFLPTCEPFDITVDFDRIFNLIPQMTNKLSTDNRLNFSFIQEFYTKILETDYGQMASDRCLSQYYSNYSTLLKSLTVDPSMPSLSQYIHPDVADIKITPFNIETYSQIVYKEFRHMLSEFSKSYVQPADMKKFLNKLHAEQLSSFFASVLPACIILPGIENIPYEDAMFKIFEHLNTCADLRSVKIKTKLFIRNYQNPRFDHMNMYRGLIEKLNNNLEPFRSKFNMRPIMLKKFCNTYFIDLHHTYYESNHITENVQVDLIKQYVMGIEWLYRYYILGEKLELSSWYYPYHIAPLVKDIVNYVSNSSNIEDIRLTLDSMPEFDLDPSELFLHVTPSDYTGNTSTSPSVSDVMHLLDGSGAPYINRCQFRWFQLLPN